MKRSCFFLILLSGWLIPLLSGCQSPFSGEPGSLFSSQTLTTALSVVPPVDPRATKSSYTGADDAVHDWNLLVFEGGLLRAKYYQDSAGDLSLAVMTDRPYQYYALANVGDLTGRFTVGTTTVEDLQALRIDASISDGLPMAWSSPSPIAFSRRQLAGGQKLSVQLTRLVGRYDIVIDQTGLSAWSFTATSLTLCGVSGVTPFAARSRATAASVVTDAATAADLAALNAGGSASYYPVENCLGDLLPAGGSPWNKIPANIPADAHPSYIEIGGTLRMTDGSALTRDVTYRFCLGENASDNFDVVRNQTHTVTLQLSDASVSGDSHHWKLETGSFTDTRSLAFTHAIILLPPGSPVEEAIVRTPAGLKYIVEADAALIQAGVSLSGGGWGAVMDSDALTLTAPAGSTPVTGTIRLRTLDGSKTAETTLIVGRIPASLVVSPTTEQRLLTGGRTVTYTVKVTYTGESGQFSVDPDNVVWTIDDGDIVEYVGGGTLQSKTKRGQTNVLLAYTENGTTVTASRSVTTYANLQSLRVEPDQIYLPGCGGENFADYRYTKNYSTSTNVRIRAYAVYHDGVEVDVSEAATWSGNLPMLFYLNSDNYSHAANAYASSTCGGQVSVYRAYTNAESARVYLGPPVDEYFYYFYNCTRLGNAPKTFITATYTEGRVTKTANVKATIVNPATPVSLSITPDAQEAFTGGFTAQFTATCTLSDGTTEVVTNKAMWSADALVTSNGNGRFTTGGTTGTTQVHASYTYNGVTVQADAALTLRERVVRQIELTVSDGVNWIWDRLEVDLGSGQSWRVRVIWEDGDIDYIYDGFSLTSSNPSVVAASGSGSQAVGLGTAVVTATFGGQTSGGVTLDVVQHSYSFELRVLPSSANLSWNETRYFYAYLYRYDQGVLDTSYGDNGRVDVSMDADWDVSNSLLAVASWNTSLQGLSGNNTGSTSVKGNVWASYGDYSDYASVTIAAQSRTNPEEPALSVDPAELSWAAEEAGSLAGRSFRIHSNTDWTVEGADAHWQFSPGSGSGDAVVTVYPVAANSATSALEARLTVEGKGASSQSVRLVHCAQTPVPATRYKVVTTVAETSIPVGGATYASASLYASTDGGASYSTLVSANASSFSDVATGTHVSVSGSTVTGVSAGTARIRGCFDGYTPEAWEDAALTVVSVPESKYLTASPLSLTWAWNAAGDGQGLSVSVSGNTAWSVRQCPDGFSYSQSNASVKVWPLAANGSFSVARTGTLVLGGDGVSDVTISLRQEARPRELTGLHFDRSAYELVRIVDGSLCYWQPFSLTADYNDGSQADVTASAGYTDQGSLTVDSSSGHLTATAACSGLTLTAAYGGLTTTARYTAQALECPESLDISRLESQDDEGRNFVLGDVTVSLTKAFESGTFSRRETGAVQCSCSSNIVFEGYEEGSGWQFHFTESGSGSVHFCYTLNGKTVEASVQLHCDSNGHVTKQ